MLPTDSLQNYEKLPSEAQRQVIDFIEFMRSRYEGKQSASQHEEGIEGSFGLLTARRSVSLDEMDQVIESEGGKL